MPKTTIALLCAVLLIPIAFLAGRGCTTQTMKISAHDSVSYATQSVSSSDISTGHGVGSGDSVADLARRPADASKFRIALIRTSDPTVPDPQIPDSLRASDTHHQSQTDSPQLVFTACSGARLPSGDSLYTCFHVTSEAPLGVFTTEQFITDRIVSIPAPRPANADRVPGLPQLAPFTPVGDPLKTLFYATAQSSTRDLFAGGLGVEVTSSSITVDTVGRITMHDRLRISAEALVLPKLPVGYLKVAGYYFF